VTKSEALAFCDRRIAEEREKFRKSGPWQGDTEYGRYTAWERARKLILKIKAKE
jgi:hypothetical protein